MTYLTRGPSLLGIGSKGHPSGEPTPFRSQTVTRSGGDSMSRCVSPTAAGFPIPTTPQAPP